MHLIAYSTVENEGYLTQKGVENLRSSFAKDIFQQDLLCIYEKQTEHRDKLRAETRDIVEDLVSKINSEIYISASIQHKLLELADRLSQTKGKKVYGYLKLDVKAIVDSIVDELSNDEGKILTVTNYEKFDEDNRDMEKKLNIYATEDEFTPPSAK